MAVVGDGQGRAVLVEDVLGHPEEFPGVGEGVVVAVDGHAQEEGVAEAPVVKAVDEGIGNARQRCAELDRECQPEQERGAETLGAGEDHEPGSNRQNSASKPGP